VHLSPLGFAACQSKKCTNRARSTPAEQEDGLNGFTADAFFNNGLNGFTADIFLTTD
jgi:hypothetical protein